MLPLSLVSVLLLGLGSFCLATSEPGGGMVGSERKSLNGDAVWSGRLAVLVAVESVLGVIVDSEAPKSITVAVGSILVFGL